MHDLLLFIAVGFAAQMVDGAIGMAYGLTGSSVMMSLGVPPALASASVHTAEIFTTAASGVSHWRLGNVDKKLFLRLALPGMLGGLLGAYVVSHVGGAIRPYVSAYLLVMGGVILWRAIRHRPPSGKPPRGVPLLGLFGGFLDAAGGGGWGPLVTSTLMGSGIEPRFAVGSTNVAEFFVTVVIAGTFIFSIDIQQLGWMIAGLIIGGVCAAPLAALVTKKLKPRPLMMIVGLVIIALSLRGLLFVPVE